MEIQIIKLIFRQRFVRSQLSLQCRINTRRNPITRRYRLLEQCVDKAYYNDLLVHYEEAPRTRLLQLLSLTRIRRARTTRTFIPFPRRAHIPNPPPPSINHHPKYRRTAPRARRLIVGRPQNRKQPLNAPLILAGSRFIPFIGVHGGPEIQSVQIKYVLNICANKILLNFAVQLLLLTILDIQEKWSFIFFLIKCAKDILISLIK